MKMNHQDRTIKNVITPPTPPPETPPTNTQRINTYVTSMKMNHQDRTIKNVITPPPRTPPNQHPAYQHLRHFNEDEPSRPYYQERYHTPRTPPNPPNQHPAYQHLCRFMKMNHRGPGRTSPCHKNHMNHIFMQHSMIVVGACTKYKNVQIIRDPESPCNQKHAILCSSVQLVLGFL